MLTEKVLLDIGRTCQKSEGQVQVQKVETGAKDAIVRAGRDHVVVVSEAENGKIYYACGKEANFISHGKWDIREGKKKKHQINLLQ